MEAEQAYEYIESINRALLALGDMPEAHVGIMLAREERKSRLILERARVMAEVNLMEEGDDDDDVW